MRLSPGEAPALENFGIYSNYAYVDSNVKEFVPVTNPMTGVGFAEHTGVVDLWYSAGALEVRAGYKYHSPFTVIYDIATCVRALRVVTSEGQD